jgi:hypothetical protein
MTTRPQGQAVGALPGFAFSSKRPATLSTEAAAIILEEGDFDALFVAFRGIDYGARDLKPVVPDRVIGGGKCGPSGTMTRFFLPIFPALFRLGDLSKAIWQWISKAERAKRWASERAAIKAEVTRAKETVDLLRMAVGIVIAIRRDLSNVAARLIGSGSWATFVLSRESTKKANTTVGHWHIPGWPFATTRNNRCLS